MKKSNKSLPAEKLKKKVKEKRNKILKITEDIEKWSKKINSLKKEISRNESIINTNLSEISQENKEFYEKIKRCIDKNDSTILTITEPFIKRNYAKIKESLFNDSEGLSSHKTTRNSRLSISNKCKCFKKDKNGKCDNCNVDFQIENDFILKSISKINNYPLPGYLKSLSKL